MQKQKWLVANDTCTKFRLAEPKRAVLGPCEARLGADRVGFFEGFVTGIDRNGISVTYRVAPKSIRRLSCG